MPEFVADIVTDFVFSLNLWQSPLLVKLQALLWFVMTESVTKSVFSKASGVSYKH